MATVLSSDRFLVQRASASYRVTFEEIAQSLGLGAGGDLHVGGNFSVDGNVTLGDSTAGCLKTLNIYNATTAHCTFTAEAAATFGSTVDIVGALTGSSAQFSTTLGVVGATTLVGTLDVSGAASLNNSLDVTNGATIDTLTVSGISSLAGAVTAGDTLTVTGATTLNNTLYVANATTLNNTLAVISTANIGGKLTVTDDADITGDVTAATVTTSGDITSGAALSVATDATVGQTLSVEGDVTVNTNKFTIAAASGDAVSAGTITAQYFVGDGSQLTNLNIPGSLAFQGSRDVTTVDPNGTETTGDFYLNTGDGAVGANWTGIGGDTIAEGDFVFLGADGNWYIGGGNDDGFVTLTTPQTITGAKTFSGIITANAGLAATGQAITADTLALTGKGSSASTVEADPDSTLVTKGYADALSGEATTKEVLIPGLYIDGTSFDGSTELTWNIEGTTTATANKLVARDALGDIYVHDIAANDIGANDISATGTVLGATGNFTTLIATTTTLLNLTVTNNASIGNDLTVAGATTSDSATITNALSAGTIAAGATTLTDALTGTTGTFSGLVTAANFTTAGKVTAAVFDIDALSALP